MHESDNYSANKLIILTEERERESFDLVMYLLKQNKKKKNFKRFFDDFKVNRYAI